MANQTITCLDCRADFEHTERDQEFYAANGWTPPKRCRPCRAVKKAEREAKQAAGGAAPARSFEEEDRSDRRRGRR